MPSGVADKTITANHAIGAVTLTIPALGWLAKDDNSNSRSLNVPKGSGRHRGQHCRRQATCLPIIHCVAAHQEEQQHCGVTEPEHPHGMEELQRWTAEAHRADSEGAVGHANEKKLPNMAEYNVGRCHSPSGSDGISSKVGLRRSRITHFWRARNVGAVGVQLEAANHSRLHNYFVALRGDDGSRVSPVNESKVNRAPRSGRKTQGPVGGSSPAPLSRPANVLASSGATMPGRRDPAGDSGNPKRANPTIFLRSLRPLRR